jgi:hypothetical protein
MDTETALTSRLSALVLALFGVTVAGCQWIATSKLQCALDTAEPLYSTSPPTDRVEHKHVKSPTVNETYAHD